jgi:hypothetical protein
MIPTSALISNTILCGQAPIPAEQDRIAADAYSCERVPKLAASPSPSGPRAKRSAGARWDRGAAPAHILEEEEGNWKKKKRNWEDEEELAGQIAGEPNGPADMYFRRTLVHRASFFHFTWQGCFILQLVSYFLRARFVVGGSIRAQSVVAQISGWGVRHAARSAIAK